nr:hemocyte protein-glutamine gamma-glutamyltransferase-like isoform X1 [Procambarus clarkii]
MHPLSSKSREQQQLQQQQQQMPPPVPPFSRPRPSYPPIHEHEYEDEWGYGGGRERYHAHQVAMRACYDLWRRRYSEMPADPAQNPAPHSHYTGAPADILRVEHVDFRPQENAKDHRTFQYDLVQDFDRPTPVFRRGQVFHLSLVTREREFDCTRDHLYLNFYFGPQPSVPKRTRVVLPVTIQKEFTRTPQKWDVRIQAQEANTLTLQVHIPATCQVGVWRCVVETATKNYPKNRTQYRAPEDVFVIFNPFSRDDAVYLENEAQRTEYVLTESGKVYRGGSRYTHGRPWVYGQFDDCVLPVACLLLERSGLAHTERGNPIKVAQALCSMIQASRNRRDHENDARAGLLEPHYEDEYRGGQNPHLWTGSVKIIQEFLFNGANPVKYGHCWVMACLMTTVCRALGMPARPTTALTSAHETQETLTIDRYIDRFGDLIERGPGRDQPDSLWAFHTWCDVWMARPDLPSGYSGWQTTDPARAYRYKLWSGCGPSSTEAVKRGDVGFSQDTSAIFSALNSFVRYYYEDDDSEWGYSPYMQHRLPVCRSVVTKAVGRHDDDGDADCEDVTKIYRDLERSEPERFTVFNACRGVRKDHVYYDYQDRGSYDVEFELQEPKQVSAGQSINVVLQVHNNTSETRTVQANISTRSAFYTGVLGSHLKRVTGQFTLAGGQKDTLTLKLDASEYQDRLVDMGFIKVTASGHVSENKQSYIDEFDFQFEKPRMSIEVPECQVGQECKATFTFSNPLDVALTDCFFSMEIGGAYRPRTVRVTREVRPRETFTYSYTFVPRRSGDHRLVASFASHQLHDVTGSRKLTIRD